MTSPASHVQIARPRIAAEGAALSEKPDDVIVSETPENVLIDALRRGDEGAFEELVRRFGPRMLAAARRLVRNEEDARDALQQAFVAALRGLATFRADSSLATWLQKIAINCALMTLRGRRRRAEVAFDEAVPTVSEGLGPFGRPMPALDHQAYRRRLLRRVLRAADELPESLRLVLVLREIEQLDTAEVALRLGLTQNAVKIRLHRARRQLLARLAEDSGVGGPVRRVGTELSAAGRGGQSVMLSATL